MSLHLNEIMKMRGELTVKAYSLILALRDILRPASQSEIVAFGPSDFTEIYQLLQSIQYLLEQQEKLFDSFGAAYQFGLLNLKIASVDEQLTDQEKIQALVKLIDNILLFLPEDWKYYFSEKYKRVLYEKKQFGQSDALSNGS